MQARESVSSLLGKGLKMLTVWTDVRINKNESVLENDLWIHKLLSFPLILVSLSVHAIGLLAEAASAVAILKLPPPSHRPLTLDRQNVQLTHHGSDS